MRDLIEALVIFMMYTDAALTSCEHDVLYMCVDPSVVKDEDKVRLATLGFLSDDEKGHFYSFRFGSC